MKPWYQSKKLWTAVITGGLNVAAVVITEYIDRPDLQAALMAMLSSVGVALLVAIGVTDAGKEAAQLRIDALRESKK